MPTKERVATITGTFLAPGVSKNGRLYTKENIARAVARMNSAIEDGTAPPISQLTSHGTDDVLQTVGRFTKVWQLPNGVAKYETAVPDTANGRDMATLAHHGYVQTVSISGSWIGDVKDVEHEGVQAETADDLEVFRVDYVPRPGVTAARIDTVAMSEGAAIGAFREEMDADVRITPEASDNCPSCGHKEAKETPVMDEATTPAAGLSEADAAKIGAAIVPGLAAAIKEALAPLAPVPAPVAEAAAVVTESTEEMVKRLLAEQKVELTAAFVKEQGLPTRTGIQTEVAASKPLHEMSPQEFRAQLVPLALTIHPESNPS